MLVKAISRVAGVFASSFSRYPISSTKIRMTARSAFDTVASVLTKWTRRGRLSSWSRGNSWISCRRCDWVRKSQGPRLQILRLLEMLFWCRKGKGLSLQIYWMQQIMQTVVWWRLFYQSDYNKISDFKNCCLKKSTRTKRARTDFLLLIIFSNF